MRKLWGLSSFAAVAASGLVGCMDDDAAFAGSLPGVDRCFV
jgi:hypothetical protein